MHPYTYIQTHLYKCVYSDIYFIPIYMFLDVKVSTNNLTEIWPFPLLNAIAFWLLMSSRAQKLTHRTGRRYFCVMLICGSWHFCEVSHSRKQLWPLGGLRKVQANLTKSSKFVMTHCLTRQCTHHKIHWEGGLAHHFLNPIYELESQSNANQYREPE